MFLRSAVLGVPFYLCGSVLAFAQASAQPQFGPTPPPATQSQAQQPMPRPYRGVQSHVDGIYVTPVPNAPFSATVQIVSHQLMPDGSDHVVTSLAHVARSSSGRIYNELRDDVPATFRGEPRLISTHIYDPVTRLNIFTNTRMHLAREYVGKTPAVTPARALAPAQRPVMRGFTQTDLGERTADDVSLHGYRWSRTIPANLSGTGQPLVVTDDYWYSEALSIYTTIRHNDPRTGEQLVVVTNVDRSEPPAALFEVPVHYKVVDETPPEDFQ